MRILIADDDDVSRLELEALLSRHNYEVVAVSDGTEAWEVLQGKDPPRLVVLDWMMDKMDGVEVCRRVRERAELRDVYMILLTSRGNREHIVTGLRTGANDYVTKPFDRDELLARVRTGANMVNMQAELAERVRELDALATIDGLTGIANWRTFQTWLEAECLRSSRYQTPLGLILLDVDHFKDINDELGHQAGDDVLKNLGKLLASCSRNTDLVARYGGEEFAVILINSDKDAAMIAAERLITCVHDERWPHRAITVSIGIATWGPGTESATQMIQQADRALYYAKQHGRNQAKHCIDMIPDDEAIIAMNHGV